MKPVIRGMMAASPLMYGSMSNDVEDEDFVPIPTSRSRTIGRRYGVFAKQRAPTDFVTQPVITITGLVAGSEIVVTNLAGDELAGTHVESSGTSEDVVMTYFGAGLSNVDISIIKPGYEYIRLRFSVPRAAASIPVQQRVDRAYLT